jgi:glyoxylase-like metal-dependent hydrolase (beta-lactamase superfamily II)
MTTPANELPGSPYFTLQRVGEGAWAAIAIPGTGSLGNAGIIDLGGAVVVFDTTLTLSAARDLRAAAERLTSQSPRYVVNSHHHGDHTIGNQIFDDATIISTSRVKELLAANTFLDELRAGGLELDVQARAEAEAVRDPAMKRDILEQADDYLVLLREIEDTHVQLPDTLIETQMTLHGATRHCELITWGGGHTPSDLVLYLPDERILYSGDLIFHQMFASIDAGDPAEWLRILAEMDKLTIDTLVPGHGQVSDHGAIASQRAFVQTLLALAQEAIATGKSADEVTQAPLPEAYRDWGFPSGFGVTLRAYYDYLRKRQGE